MDRFQPFRFDHTCGSDSYPIILKETTKFLILHPTQRGDANGLAFHSATVISVFK